MLTTLRRTCRVAAVMATALTLAMPAAAQPLSIGAGLTTSVGPLTRDAAGIQSLGQSFIVPPFVSQLSSFRLSLTSAFNGSALRFDAYIYSFNTATRSITGPALWSQLNVAGSGNEFSFDDRTFNTGNVTLNAGATYLFLLSASNQGAGVPLDAGNLVGANDANGYAGGALWVASNGSNFAALSTAGAFGTVAGIDDAAFTATFVTPEPATIVLTAFGLIGLGVVSRRRGAVRRGR